MSVPPLLFPTSGTCLWDRQAVGQTVEVSVDCSCWVCVRVTQSVLQLAVRAHRQASQSPLHCLLVGSASVAEDGAVVVEVDRLDMGRDAGSGLEPTALVPGDVVIYCTVGSGKSVLRRLAEKEVLQRLQGPALAPSALLHLQLHISTPHPYMHPANTLTSLSCCSVCPSACKLTPVMPLPIVPTALARNLSGPLSLSSLQSSVKWGYLTMEVTRKLVVLLQSDPNVQNIPLVGVWLSGVSSIKHPAVWAAVLHYQHSSVLVNKAGEAGLCLIYTGNNHSLFEFSSDAVDSVQRAYGDAEVEPCSQSPPAVIKLFPEQSRGCSPSLEIDRPASYLHRNTAPQPSPRPTLARDSQLSCVSIMESSLASARSLASTSSNAVLVQSEVPVTLSSQQMIVFPDKTSKSHTTQEWKPQQLLTEHSKTMVEKATNTGVSLFGPSVDISEAWDTFRQSSDRSCVATEQDVDVTTVTQSSVHTHESINLDLCSFGASILQSESASTVTSGARNVSSEDVATSPGNTQPVGSDLLHRKEFYDNMLASVRELLETPVSEGYHHQTRGEPGDNPDLSVLPVPHIASITLCSEPTLDEAAHAADVITMKYVGGHHTDTTVDPSTTTSSCSYLPTLQPIPPQPHSHILDLGRLRSLPKLL